MSSRKTDAEIEALWQAHAWGGKHHEELREDHRRARADRAALLEALRDVLMVCSGYLIRLDKALLADAREAIAQAEGR